MHKSTHVHFLNLTAGSPADQTSICAFVMHQGPVECSGSKVSAQR